jgi:hypothetical protein
MTIKKNNMYGIIAKFEANWKHQIRGLLPENYRLILQSRFGRLNNEESYAGGSVSSCSATDVREVKG